MKLVYTGVAVLAMIASANAQDTGKLVVKVNPGRTGVFVDGKYLGPAANLKHARTYKVPVGEHEVVLREPRYQEQSQKVTIVKGKKTVVAPAMQAKTLTSPPYGVLRIRGFEKYAPVYVNGAFVGHADEFDAKRQGLLLNPGEYEVKVTSVDGAPLVTQKVTIREKVTEIVRKK